MQFWFHRHAKHGAFGSYLKHSPALGKCPPRVIRHHHSLSPSPAPDTCTRSQFPGPQPGPLGEEPWEFLFSTRTAGASYRHPELWELLLQKAHLSLSCPSCYSMCWESVTSSLLSCVQPSRLFPDVPMNCITAHYYTLLLTSSLLALSLPFPSQSFLIFGTCFIGSWSEYLILKLRITLTNSCGRLCSLVITVSFGPFFFSCIKFTFYSHTHSTQALILLYLLLLSSQLHTIWRD